MSEARARGGGEVPGGGGEVPGGGGYAPQRVRQLRLLLWVAIGAALVLAGVAAVLLAGGGDAPRVLLVLVLPAALLLVLAGAAQVLLARGHRAARALTAASGVVAVMTGLLLSRTGAGLLVAVVGVPLLLVAVLPGRDEPPSQPGAG